MARNTTSVLLGMTCGLLVLGVYLKIADGAVAPKGDEIAKQRFIAARPAEHPLLTFARIGPSLHSRKSFDDSDEPLVGLISSVDPLQESASGDERWNPTAFALNDLFWLRDERLQCAYDHALPLTTPCTAEYSLVVEPTETPGLGLITTGDVISSPMGLASDADESACAAYTDCLLDARIGEMIPTPTDVEGRTMIRQPVVYGWAAASLFDPQHVRELIGSYESTLAADAVGDDLTQKLDQNQLDYLRVHLESLSEVEE